jgi:NRAMP (natural resistance-associated macrophage protein)-like metal ion transporter
MAAHSDQLPERRKHDPTLEARYQSHTPRPVPKGVFRSIGLGLITGAADDDPSAIGTYATAGAQYGTSLLWMVPVLYPMMFAVVYLSSKVGQVTGQGLFAVIKQHYPRWLLHFALAGVIVGNTIEAGADLGGMAAALNLIVPLPIGWLVIGLTAAMLLLQIYGSYTVIRNIFRWLALALLAYLGSALLAKPGLSSVIRGTLIPTIHLNREFLAMVLAIIGTSLSAYIYTWQSNQDVEEDISMGRRRLIDRIGTTKAELSHSARDIAFGMFFSALVMYFIVLSTAATLFKAHITEISTAAQAAQALSPLAGKAAGLLFAIGVVGVGFIAVPVMTTGAAYDLCQTFGWPHGLHKSPRQCREFYISIALVTMIAMTMNFFGLNPIKALVWAGMVQGFSTPFLMLMVMLITNKRAIMGRWVNTPWLNFLGWITTISVSLVSLGLVVSWFF